mmetsp:Transcript_23067/g.57327  ORF Transcript_23067/g.57327 Transcript_23067/m.57327 type:complete len:272 (-) Transcript_23067:1209-2024(-)
MLPPRRLLLLPILLLRPPCLRILPPRHPRHPRPNHRLRHINACHIRTLAVHHAVRLPRDDARDGLPGDELTKEVRGVVAGVLAKDGHGDAGEGEVDGEGRGGGGGAGGGAAAGGEGDGVFAAVVDEFDGEGVVRGVFGEDFPAVPRATALHQHALADFVRGKRDATARVALVKRQRGERGVNVIDAGALLLVDAELPAVVDAHNFAPDFTRCGHGRRRGRGVDLGLDIRRPQPLLGALCALHRLQQRGAAGLRIGVKRAVHGRETGFEQRL